MFYFFARKPSLSAAGFHHHYLALHTQSGMRQAELGTKGGETRPRHMRATSRTIAFIHWGETRPSTP